MFSSLIEEAVRARHEELLRARLPLRINAGPGGLREWDELTLISDAVRRDAEFAGRSYHNRAAGLRAGRGKHAPPRMFREPSWRTGGGCEDQAPGKHEVARQG